MCHGICLAVRGQLSGISYLLSPVTGDSRIPLRASDLHSKYFYPFSHLASVLFLLLIVKKKNLIKMKCDTMGKLLVRPKDTGW